MCRVIACHEAQASDGCPDGIMTISKSAASEVRCLLEDLLRPLKAVLFRKRVT